MLKPSGKLIAISGPPDPAFADETKSPWFVKQIMRVLSFKIGRKAKHRGVSYSFLFMRASGQQLREIAALVESGVVCPVVDRVFPFESTAEAIAYVESGRTKGKVVVKVK